MISGLYNGVFLIFFAFNVFIESIERLYEPVGIRGSKLLIVSVAGLLVNCIGLVFFHEHAHGHSHGEEGCPHAAHSKKKIEHNHDHSHSHDDHDKSHDQED